MLNLVDVGVHGTRWCWGVSGGSEMVGYDGGELSTKGVGLGLTWARSKGLLEHEPALGPPKRGQPGNLATQTLAWTSRARATAGQGPPALPVNSLAWAVLINGYLDEEASD
jgi:hypothetical protein